MRSFSAVIALSVFAGFVHAQTAAPQTVKGLKLADGLEATLWAAEPNVVNPTNIDIDERGRIWYLEAVNYRRQLKNQPDLRKTGDRIVILEDTNGDGIADSKKIFHEDPSLRSPLGIAVLGDRVYVSQSPDLFVYTKDANDKVVKRDVLLTGWSGVDHDHGLHAVTFGHDGRLYFNSGDQGFDVTGPDGRRAKSSRKGEYYAGTALRMNMDGTDFTVLAHNFRNPFELAMDSFGSIWQSDNDDDGNAWTRFNYVMDGGNYGYWGPGGRSWREDRGTHFHQELPGVIPNIARLGAGSPCGLVIYEGKLLPPKYRHMPLHAEAGKRELRAYLIEQNAAGYSLTADTMASAADPWFRPSDVAVGPDGALYVADWYDPGVGGHNMGDHARGRIYRIAPKGFRASKPAFDWNSDSGLITALGNPAQAVRHLAWTKLRGKGAAALPAQRAAGADDPVLRARALWLIAALGESGRADVERAASDPDPRFRVLAARLTRMHAPARFMAAARGMAKDASAMVRREIAVMLRHERGDDALAVWRELARQYDGADRWYLESLGLAAEGREAAAAAIALELFPAPDSRGSKLLWRLRAPGSEEGLISTMRSSAATVNQRIDAMEAVAARTLASAARAVSEVIQDASAPAKLREAALERLGKRVFSEWSDYRGGDDVAAAVNAALVSAELRKPALELVKDLEDARFADAVLAIGQDAKAPVETRVLAIEAVGRAKKPEHAAALDKLFRAGPMPARIAALRGLGYLRPAGLDASLQRIVTSAEPNDLRSEALRILSRTPRGANLILDMEQKQTLPAEMKNLAANLMSQQRDPAVMARAAKILPPPATSARTKLPPPRTLAARQGDATAGKRVFNLESGPNCAGCHSLTPNKQLAGPNLSAIGDKLGKEAMVDAILNPSAGIAHEYVTSILDTKSNGQVIGIVVEDTPRRVVVRTETETIRLDPASITGRRKSNLSMMPEDLVTKMTEQQLVDLLEYLMSLREEKRAAL